MTSFRDEFLRQAEELWDEHEEQINAILTFTRDKRTGVAFKLNIDDSGSKPVLETSIRASKGFSDKRTSEMDDPAQGTFTEITEGSKKGPGRPKAKPEPENED